MTDEAQLLRDKYDGVATPEFEADQKRLAGGEPLAYVIGWQPFLGLKIYLDSKPLIPRVETEWWIEQLLATVEGLVGGGPIQFLDLCAGSGAIGCAALKLLPKARVYFGEIDPAHEATILKNIRKNGLDESRAIISIADLFGPFGDLRFDVIACNPPYIPEGRELDKSVADFEPHQALFSGSDGLGLIRRIARELPTHLKKGGIAWIECDSAHSEEAYTHFNRTDFAAHILHDQYNQPRVIVVQSL